LGWLCRPSGACDKLRRLTQRWSAGL